MFYQNNINNDNKYSLCDHEMTYSLISNLKVL